MAEVIHQSSIAGFWPSQYCWVNSQIEIIAVLGIVLSIGDIALEQSVHW